MKDKYAHFILDLFSKNSGPLFIFNAAPELLYSNSAAESFLLKNDVTAGTIISNIFDSERSISEVFENNSCFTSQLYINEKIYLAVTRGIESYPFVVVEIFNCDLLLDHEKKWLGAFNRQNKKNEIIREYIAGNLHGTVAQNLAYLKLELQRLDEMNNYKQTQELDKLYDNINSIRDEVKDYCNILLPKTIEIDGAGLAISTLFNKLKNKNSFEGELCIIGESVKFEKWKELEIYRIVEEALSNVVKHSGAEAVNIEILNSAEARMVVVHDNGCGFDLNKKLESINNGFGLLEMQSRAKAIGGNLIIETEENDGTTILLTIKRGR
ncbi:MAG: hypothetical protein K9J16_18410 [Melioribacteraceae bacterium]|nr:hypothetical protein [Melioribacteraceae bacterium]MCF8357039.1 hypothetical protein [Melioribacteraceae bacterium]MCF8396240.1 hypothetical protein [Melioribacteraceae bacterium]MCF8421163.1 hypothetical protein [Melioribacteraceae bacterium]